MVLIESPKTDPAFNLALEEYVFEQADPARHYLMLWQNDRTVVVGVHQNTAQEVNASFIREHHIRVVRRLSGGGAVYHDRGNLNYTLISEQSADNAFCFERFSRPVIRAMRAFGTGAEAGGRNDILIGGKKVSGNAQYVKHGRILHHGCIMIDTDLEMVAGALHTSDVKYRSRAIASVRSRVTTVKNEADREVSVEAFKQELIRCVSEGETEFSTYELNGEDLRAVNDLAAKKYDTWEWNYGSSPDYDVCKERRFDAGVVTAFLSVSEGKIASVRFYGDFFGTGDIRELEDALRGVSLNGGLEETLSRLGAEAYIHGVKPSELAALLTE